VLSHALRADGFDASEDGTGRGTPIVPVGIQERAVCENPDAVPDGVGVRTDGTAYTLEARAVPQAVMTLAIRGREEGSTLEVREDGTANTLYTPNGGRGGIGVGAVAYQASDYANGMFARCEQASPLTAGTDRSRAAPIVGAVAYGIDEEQNGSEELFGCLKAREKGGGFEGAVAFANEGGNDGSGTETYAAEILQSLRKQVGEEAFEEWGTGVASALQSTAVLQSELHEERLQGKAEDWNILGDHPLPRSKDGLSWPVYRLWDAFCSRRPPQGWRPSQQLARELAAYLSKLPYQSASFSPLVHGLREVSKGLGLLREALSEVQEVWRPLVIQAQPAHASRETSRVGGAGVMAVRRLTPRLRECEKLQGVPPGFTQVPYRGKPMADGPRYKMLGNGFAIPVLAWIGRRIEEALEAGKRMVL
jgi:hypothetical protein